MTTETKFLTLEEAKEKAYDCHEYKEGVYKYIKDGKETLVENGKVLADGVDWVDRHDGKWISVKESKRTLIENGKVLIDNADYIVRYEPGVYSYEKDGKQFEVKNGITTKIKY